MDETLKSVEVLIEADLERAVGELKGRLERGEIGQIGFGEDERALREDAQKKVANMREMYRVATKGEIAERVRCAFSFSFVFS
jgi:STIP1 family protein 1